MAGNGVRNCKHEQKKLLDGSVSKEEEPNSFFQRFINTYRYKCCLLNWILLMFCSKGKAISCFVDLFFLTHLLNISWWVAADLKWTLKDPLSFKCISLACHLTPCLKFDHYLQWLFDIILVWRLNFIINCNMETKLYRKIPGE